MPKKKEPIVYLKTRSTNTYILKKTPTLRESFCFSSSAVDDLGKDRIDKLSSLITNFMSVKIIRLELYTGKRVCIPKRFQWESVTTEKTFFP